MISKFFCVMLLLFAVLFISTKGQTIVSYSGVSYAQVRRISQRMQSVLFVNNLYNRNQRRNVMNSMRTTVADELNSMPMYWNTMICHSDTCSWSFPSCSNTFVTLGYNNFYVEASMCNDGMTAYSLGTNGTTTKENGDPHGNGINENQQVNGSP